MKIEINTDTDSYIMWKKIQKCVEAAYRDPVNSLSVGPGGRKPGTINLRSNIF